MFNEGLLKPKPDIKKEEEETPAVPDRIILESDDTKKFVTAGAVEEYTVKMSNQGKADTFAFNVGIVHTSEHQDNAGDWGVRLSIGRDKWDVTSTQDMNRDLYLKEGEVRNITAEIIAARDVLYGDALHVLLTTTSQRDPANSDSITLEALAKQSILVAKTQIGHEKAVADSITSKEKDAGVLSVLSPTNLRGYIFIEAMNSDRVERIVKGIRRARGLVDGETSFDEIKHYLVPKSAVSAINEGDIVELISGPFKGEKARVQRIDKSKEEITVELFEAPVPIPVTVNGASVRVIEKDN